ncbi:MAG: hypothetical protein NTW87_21530 [Planctomycetota bacterium]|nr:hypothetical protein [Planctomycetota bacterium]
MSFVFMERPAGAPLPPLSIRSTVCHELVHQFDPGGNNAMDHDTERAWDNLDNCLMDDASPRSGAPGAGRNDQNDTHELCREHIYNVRDKEDGL